MSRRNDLGTSARYGEWEGYEIHVDAKGKFFVNDDGNRLEAPSLDALKAKLKKPVTFAQPVKGVRLIDRWDWEDDDREKDHEVIEVTGLSPTGHIYYVSENGRKERFNPRGYHDRKLYVFDEALLTERTRLLKIEHDTKAALEKNGKQFVVITRENAEEIRTQQADSAGEKA